MVLYFEMQSKKSLEKNSEMDDIILLLNETPIIKKKIE